MSNKELFYEICLRHNINAALFTQPRNQSIEIGFLGEFSSGKSSLINSIIGQDFLITGLGASSKNIVKISFDKELNEACCKEIKTNDIKELSKDEFMLAQSSAKATLALSLPIDNAKEQISQMSFVDMPGTASLDELDTSTTLGYLPMLDAIVFVQDINIGSLSESALNLILKIQDLAPELLSRLIVVLSKADTKMPQNAKSIKEHVKAQLEPYGLGTRVVLSSTSSENKELLEMINQVAQDKDELLAKRENKLLLVEFKLLFEDLKQRLDTLSYSNIKLDEQISITQEKIDKLQQDIAQQDGKLVKFIENLQSKLEAELIQNSNLLKNKQLDDFALIIQNVVDGEVREYFMNFDIDGFKIDAQFFEKNLQNHIAGFSKSFIDILPAILIGIEKIPHPIVQNPISKAAINALKFISGSCRDFVCDIIDDLTDYPQKASEIARDVASRVRLYVKKIAKDEIFAPLYLELERELDVLKDTQEIKAKHLDSLLDKKESLKADIAIVKGVVADLEIQNEC